MRINDKRNEAPFCLRAALSEAWPKGGCGNKSANRSAIALAHAHYQDDERLAPFQVMPDLPKDPPDLGSLQLRAALEEALLRCPAEAEPPELGPVLRLPLLPTEKLKLVQGKRILSDNLEWNPSGLPHGLEPLRTALNILEKYGRNLLSPRPPRHWRGVRFGNPVFKSTVGAIQGGRDVLKLLGYTEESGEGLSFPPPPHGPRPQRVAAVIADVLVLRAELDLLLLNQHPNPQFFTQILLGGDEWSLVSDAVPVPAQLLPA
ncbi:E3 ubiquitin-protein ligase RNF31-like, partial [Zonotrichia leucophrys gambelii]|uniref:E3 ubiquitin-protein ligase RNF31-like n=1 Tax=Zonotrichia leucophrys gambelii TaxID=257770 RepID=UPI0031409FC0